MTRTRKAIAAVLGMLCAVCMAMLVLSACGPAEQAELKSIKITTPPTTVEYLVGEEFDATGMIVTATYDDETTKEVTGWTFEAPEMKLAEGKFEASLTVKVSYTEGEVTKTANQTIKVHNYIESATIETYPKQEYFIGQAFEVDGMEINATLEDGTQKLIEVTSSNAKWEPKDGLSSADKEVVVTIGGYEIKVPVATLNAIYVEAETGYRNGALIEQSTGDSGNIRVDATTENAKSGTEELFKAQLRADFALEQIKSAEDYDAATLAQPSESVGVTVGGKVVTKEYDAIVAWLNDTANAEAIAEYEASDEYKAAVEEYLASDEFVKDYSFYVAHDSGTGENYLGQNSQGQVLSFVFDSSAAAKGSIAFRLASSYLYRDNNGGWLAVIMGDIQFNKLCEFYVNGVKAEIADDVLLEGGMTADGSANNILWCNWKEVQFNNVQFVEGRNVVELRFLYHGITAANNYNFAANVDTLLVAPEEGSSAQLDTYDNTNVKVESAISAIKIEGTTLTIEGALTGTSKGYFGDILDVRVGNSYANLTLNGNNFTATADVSNFRLGEYAITVANEALEKGDLNIDTTGKVTGDNTYALAVSEDGVVTLNITSDKMVELKSAVFEENFKNATLKLEVRDGKVCLVIGGGVCEYTYTGFTEDEAKVAAAEFIKDLFYMDLQSNPNEGSSDSSWGTPVKNTHYINVLTSTTFEVVIDLSDVDPDALTMHFVHANADGTFPTGGGSDFKPDIAAMETQVLLEGNMQYELIYDKEAYFGCVGIKITNASTPTFAITSIALENVDGKATVVYTGTFKNYTADEIKALKIDGEGDATVGIKEFTLVWEVNEKAGTFTIKADISQLPKATDTWNGFYYMHAGFNAVVNEEENKAGNGNISESAAKIVDGKGTLVVGDKKYTLTAQWGTRGVMIEAYDSTAKENTINPAMTLVQEGDKIYVVVSGTFRNMTEAEVKAAYAFDAEVGQGANTGKVTKFTEEDGNIVWTFDAAAGTFTVKLDVTNLAAEGPFWMHYASGSDLTATADANSAITLNGKTYVFRNAVFSWGDRDLLCIDAAA